jgi:type IV pilus assembly protein PilC
MNNYSTVKVSHNQPELKHGHQNEAPPKKHAVPAKRPNVNFMRVSLQEQILFAKRLSMLVRSGVPILSALTMLAKHAKSRSVIKIMTQVVKDVENGQFLSTALRPFKKIFGTFAINIIEVGEVSGNLSENLNYLAEELSKKQALRRKLVNAMVYPALIIAATIGIIILLTVFLFPKILPIFASFESELPLSTKVLIWFSSTMINYGLFIAAGAVLLVIGMAMLFKVRKVKKFFHQVLLKLPIIGSVYQGYYITNICRTFGLLLKSNVAIVKAAYITGQTCGNLVYEDMMVGMAEAITKGDKVSTYLGNFPKIFPPLLTQMIAVAESAGTLTDTLDYLAALYEKEVDDMTKNLSTALEPVLMIIMGGLVGFIAISIITPIYELTQHIKP